MDSYQKLLAEGVLTEDKVFTYRLLSRTLRVHPNTAKQMLYDFHKTQNDRRPGAVHATYLVHGAKKAVGHLNGGDGDVDMTNTSPPDNGSIGEGIPLFTLSLVPEDQLKDTLAQYEEVFSVHVYSVGPNPVKDMALLADVAEQALRLGPAEGPSPSCIVNSEVRRRERKGAPRPAPKAAPQPTPKVAPQPPAKAAPAGKTAKQEAKPSIFKSAPASSKAKEEPKSSTQAYKDADTPASSAPAKKPPAALKRGGSSSSGIMQAFSKAASMPKKEKPAATSNPATPSGDDSSMHVMSDDGEDDEDVPQPKARTAGRKTKKQREEELRLMMEEEDDDDDEPEKARTPEEEPMEEEAPAPEPLKEEPAEVVTASEGGRRRGKRRVMRKKQIMDDQGYLVTIQEQGWESFSEDEASPATKAKTAGSAPAAATAKPAAKKAGPKGSQGNIMSFFSKK